MRRFAISDIHGCLKTFQALLETIRFSKTDELFLLGDYIDRGPDSKGVIDHIWKMQEEGHTVHCLRGNHEQMLIDDRLSPNKWYPGEAATLRSFGVAHHIDIPSPYIKWMRGLPHFIETEGYILVHAGLNFKLENPMEGLEAMLWIRQWCDRIDRQWLGERIVVHGHTPMHRERIEKQIGKLEHIPVVDIDAGCVWNQPGLQHLCALELDSRELHFQINVEDREEEPESFPDSPMPEMPALPRNDTKVLYFDIDGTLLDYDDEPKAALLDGKLEKALKEAGFDHLACVSGWVDILAAPVMQIQTLSERKEALHKKLAPLFPDREWFLDKLMLVYDTDHRCRYIDLQSDWYYVDDWADHFFTAALGPQRYEAEQGRRILLCDHEGDGSDVLVWLEKIGV
jgi:serine/threonine protein phosphatase 1